MSAAIAESVMQSTDSMSMTSFAELTELLGGDDAKVLYVLRAFLQAVSEDLLLLDRAVREGDAHGVRTVAHRIAMACHLVGEVGAAHMMEAVVKASALSVVDPVLTQSVNQARVTLIDSIANISLYLEAR